MLCIWFVCASGAREGDDEEMYAMLQEPVVASVTRAIRAIKAIKAIKAIRTYLCKMSV